MFEAPSAQTISRDSQGIFYSNQNDISCTSVIFGKATKIRPVVESIEQNIIIHDESGYKLDKSKLDRLCNLLKQSFEHDQDQKNSGVTIEDNPVVHRLVEDKSLPIILKLPRGESKAKTIDESCESQPKPKEPDNNTIHLELSEMKDDDGFVHISIASSSKQLHEGLRKRKP